MRHRARGTGGHRRGALLGIAIGAGLLVTTAAAWMLAVPREAPTTDLTVVSGARTAEILPLARRETRPTLDPARFTGKAAAAYQVARDIPEVLDQLQCYCACGSQYGHASLLSCYTDGHGST